MHISDIERILESWAPRWTAWEKDNVGLQIGDRRRPVKTIGVALEATPEVVAEALRKKAQLLITHHPLFFRPPRSLTTDSVTGRVGLELAESGIALYSAHTNLDFAPDGVSMTLARVLGLEHVRFLTPLEGSLAKLVVFVPEGHEGRIIEVASAAGAGVIGNYSHCSFRTPGTGTFLGNERSNPAAGKRGSIEQASELRVEMVVPRARVTAVVERIRDVHPYEEMAYDVIPVSTPDVTYGMGAIGTLDRPQSLQSFLRTVKEKLGSGALRFAGDPRATVRRVAVCGGSGSELLSAARSADADVLVTADVKYHTFHEVPKGMALVDAGHWETEQVILQPLAQRLRRAAKDRGEQVTVYVTKVITSPVHTI